MICLYAYRQMWYYLSSTYADPGIFAKGGGGGMEGGEGIQAETRNIFKKDIRRLSNTYNLNATKFAGFRRNFLPSLESKTSEVVVSFVWFCAQLALCI